VKQPFGAYLGPVWAPGRILIDFGSHVKRPGLHFGSRGASFSVPQGFPKAPFWVARGFILSSAGLHFDDILRSFSNCSLDDFECWLGWCVGWFGLWVWAAFG